MTWPWLAYAALGAGHGINPAMGWLFAVALGLQAGHSRAVWQALPPLAVGHLLAVGVAALLAAAVGQVVPVNMLQWMIGASLVALGGIRLIRHGHPRYGGMRVGFRELTIWSFLMATAHGAGLMVLPLLVANVSLGGGAATSGHAANLMHGAHAAQANLLPMPTLTSASLWATLVHTAGYLLVTGLVALLVYRKLGLRFLKTMWINLDLIWGGALLITGAVTLIA